ncbi:MAG: IS1595 family transposase, partial [Rhodoferax sp.]
YRFNRRFDLKSLAQRLLVAAAQCGPHSQGSIRMVAEVHC